MAFLKVFLCLLAMLFLPGCGTAQRASGEILEYHADAEGKLTGLTIQTDEGEAMTFVPAEDTPIITWLGSDDLAEIQMEFPGAVLITVQYSGRETALTKPDGTRLPAYEAEWVMDTAFLQMPEVYTFSDGVAVDLWEGGGHHSYCLSDRTELLRVQEPHGPDNSYVVNHESFDDLSEQAQANVLAFYKAQGIRYNEQETLDLAYSAYRDDPENFGTFWLEQSVSPFDSNEHMFTFVTSVSLPAEDGQLYLLQMYHNFDRFTGEPISSFDCFALPPEEFLPTLLSQTNYQDWDNSPSLDEMLAHLRPEYIALDRDSIYLDFPYGVLPSQEFSFGIGFNYTAEVLDILQPWARPAK